MYSFAFFFDRREPVGFGNREEQTLVVFFVMQHTPFQHLPIRTIHSFGISEVDQIAVCDLVVCFLVQTHHVRLLQLFFAKGSVAIMRYTGFVVFLETKQLVDF